MLPCVARAIALFPGRTVVVMRASLASDGSSALHLTQTRQQEEYSNLETLERRLQVVARRMVGPSSRQQSEVVSGTHSGQLEGHSVPPALAHPSPVAPDGAAGDHYGGTLDQIGVVKLEHRAPSGAAPGAPGAGHPMQSAGPLHGAHAVDAGRSGYKMENDTMRTLAGTNHGAGAEAGSLGSPEGAVANGGHFRTADTPRYDAQVRSCCLRVVRARVLRRPARRGTARSGRCLEATGFPWFRAHSSQALPAHRHLDICRVDLLTACLQCSMIYRLLWMVLP